MRVMSSSFLKVSYLWDIPIKPRSSRDNIRERRIISRGCIRVCKCIIYGKTLADYLFCLHDSYILSKMLSLLNRDGCSFQLFLVVSASIGNWVTAKCPVINKQINSNLFRFQSRAWSFARLFVSGQWCRRTLDTPLICTFVKWQIDLSWVSPDSVSILKRYMPVK